MYTVPIIGALVMKLNGEAIGIVESVEHTKEGVHIYIYDGEDDDPKTDKEHDVPAPFAQLRAVAER